MTVKPPPNVGEPATSEMEALGVGGGIVAALEQAWSAIQHVHPELPPAVLVTGAGSHGSARALRLGHFAASRWQLGEHDAAALGEIFVGGEGLARGARDVLATLLHEAAHALAHQRGVQDTSRQGRYHNRKFKVLAEGLGLHIDHDPRIGWSLTALPDPTAQRYQSTIAERERALTAYRAGEPPARPDAKPVARNLLLCACGCGRRLRIAAATLALGPIRCGVCHTPFRLDADRDSENHVHAAIIPAGHSAPGGIAGAGADMTRRVVDPMHEAELLFRSLTGEIREAADVAIETRDPGDWRTVARLAGRAQRHARELAADTELTSESEA